MRVLYAHYGGEWLAGCERSLLSLLDGCRHSVHAHVVSNSRAMCRALAHRKITSNLVDDMVGLSRLCTLSRRMRPWGRSLLTLMGAVRTFRPDVIHANSLWPSQPAVLAGRLTGIPIVCHARSVNARRFSECSLRRWGNAIIAISQAAAQPCRKMRVTTAKVFVIYNPVAPIEQHESRSAPNQGGPVRLAFAGRLSTEKGPDRAVQLAGWLLRNAVDFTLSLYGEGETRSHVEALAAREGLGRRVRFCGFVPDLPEQLARTDVLLVPSWFEGLGRVVVEAALVGTPAIATSVGGLPETMIDGQTGMLVEDFESDQQRQRILSLLSDPSLRVEMGRAARKFCQVRFSPEHAVERTLAVYRYVLGQGDGPDVAATAAEEETCRM